VASQDIDPGLAAVAEIWQTRWQLDEKWTEPLPRGFAWYPHRLCHELVASPLFEDFGTALSRVTSRICIVEDIQEDLDKVDLQLAIINRNAICSALHLDRASRTISSLSSMLIHEETLAWRPAYYSSLAHIQVCQAERGAEHLAEALDGKVAVRAHPTSGLRSAPDEILGKFDEILSPGVNPDAFRDAQEFAALELLCKKLNLATFGAEEAAFAAEMEFGGDTALFQLHADTPHPNFGTGLLFTLQLPLNLDVDRALEWASALNDFEANQGYRSHLQGAWTVAKRANGAFLPAYSGFRPAILYRPGIIQDEFMALIMRARFLHGVFVDESRGPGDPWAVILQRLRLGTLH
jgi:hypothetical protein